MLVSGNNSSCTKEPVDKVVYDPDGRLITETPEFIAVSMGEELNMNHVICGLLGTFYLFIYLIVITSRGFNNIFMVNTQLHGLF